MPATLREIAAQIGGELIGDPGHVIARIAPLEAATPDAITFLANPRYRAQLAATRAGCVIVAPAMKDAAVALSLYAGGNTFGTSSGTALASAQTDEGISCLAALAYAT